MVPRLSKALGLQFPGICERKGGGLLSYPHKYQARLFLIFLTISKVFDHFAKVTIEVLILGIINQTDPRDSKYQQNWATLGEDQVLSELDQVAGPDWGWIQKYWQVLNN